MSKSRSWPLLVGLALAFAPLPPAMAASRPTGVTLPGHHTDMVPGGLFAADPKLKPMDRKNAFVLEHTSVDARVAGNVARVEVTQRFRNPFKKPMEAVYVFPLPDDAAVDEMEMRIGKRVVKGVIKKREEAKKIYDAAKAAGQTAALLDQERDNMFTQSVANILPGESITVTIRYAESLSFEGGDYQFVFPMVVGPRYIPGAPNGAGGTTQVPDAGCVTPHVLKPGMRSGHDIAVKVRLGGPLTGPVSSPSHRIAVQEGPKERVITLAKNDRIPNKDLVLRYRVAGEVTRTEVLAQQDPRGGHFALYLVPALHVPARAIVPKDVVFLMDTSGSQSGAPIAQCKALMRRFLSGLNANDTFTIIDFANVATRLSAKPLANTAANRALALRYVEGLDANGGTELMNGIKAVLAFPPAPKGRLRSVVLLTDGLIGNEGDIIAEVKKSLPKGNRLYTFGCGSGVNRFLLNRLAEVGRGTVSVIGNDEVVEPVVEKFFRRINDPVLTEVKVSWEGSGKAPDIYPDAPPDLFANQPLVLFGKKPDGRPGILRVEGTIAGGVPFLQRVPVEFDPDGHPAVPQLWARARLHELANQMYGNETKDGVALATSTALDYHLMSPYTSFVAVTEEVRVKPDGKKIKVEVPLLLPEGMSYDGVFGQDKEKDLNGRAGAGTTAGKTANRRLSQYGAPPAPKPQPYPISPPMHVTRPNVNVAQPATEEKMPYLADLTRVPHVDVVSAVGLDLAARSDLARELLAVKLPVGASGRLILALTLNGGRVTAITTDTRSSTLTDAAAIAAIEKALKAWKAPGNPSGNVQLTLDVAT